MAEKADLDTPRVKWVETTMANLWQLNKRLMPEFQYIPLDLKNNDHIEAVKLAAEADLHEITPGYIIKQ